MDAIVLGRGSKPRSKEIRAAVGRLGMSVIGTKRTCQLLP